MPSGSEETAAAGRRDGAEPPQRTPAAARASADRRRGRATRSSSDPATPRTMLGSHAASHGGSMRPLRQRLTEPQQDVVDEDDAMPIDEAGELAVAAVGRAERQADQAEDQARRPESRTSCGSRTAGCAGTALRARISVGARAQLGDRHLAVALRRPAARETRLRARD